MAKTYKRTLVTSALPYANGYVHLGHLAGAYLPADTYVRYLRLKGEEAVFICGSDEHGVPITLRADEEGKTPKDIIDRYHPANGAAFAKARVDFDFWGRTSDPLHAEVTQEIFKALDAGGHIVKRTMKQWYSEKKKQFLPDRYVEGTCPHCGYKTARGDQCDSCGRTYESLDLAPPIVSRLPGDGSAPVVKETSHWMLKLGDFQGALAQWLEKDCGHWRSNVLQGSQGWLTKGLRERSITRDTAWGVKIPVADPEAEGKRIYVWFDAPIGYITFTRQWAEKTGRNWRNHWQSPDSRIIHFIGKDNIPFHAIIFPAMMMGASEREARKYQLVETVVSNEYLNFGADKFSKSKGNMLRIDAFVDAFGSDALRYYMTAVAPESSDSQFTWEHFQAKVNNELANNLGNFAHRTLTFTQKYFAGRVPEGMEFEDADLAMLDGIVRARDAMDEALGGFRFKQALEELMRLSGEGNQYFDACAPWKTRKTDPAACGRAIHVCLQVVGAISVLGEPFMPDACARLRASLGEAAPKMDGGAWGRVGPDLVAAKAALGVPEVLIKKMDDAALEAGMAKVTAAPLA
jgi:methionyl-tRNA synthetase